MQLTCNRDYIACRYARYVSAKEEEVSAINRVKELESEISRLKNELWHAANGIILAERIQNSCLDDIAWLEQFDKDGKEFTQIDALEDKGIEITKGWRNRK